MKKWKSILKNWYRNEKTSIRNEDYHERFIFIIIINCTIYFDYNSDGYLCIYHWEKEVIDKKSVEVEKSSSECLTNSELQDNILNKKNILSQDEDDSLENMMNKKYLIYKVWAVGLRVTILQR
jgi:hypothetical protein